MKGEIVRVLRVLEYVGPREWVEQCIAQRTVKGTKLIDGPNGERSIREAIVGEVPDVLALAAAEERINAAR